MRFALFAPVSALTLVPAAGIAQTDEMSAAVQKPKFTAMGLPPGIYIHPTTGVISGIIDRAAIIDGQMDYEVIVRMQDANGGVGQVRVHIAVPNNAPIAVDDMVLVDENASVTIPVLNNDQDADGDTLVLMSATSELGHSLSFHNSAIIYQPPRGAPVESLLRYIISDGHGGTAIGQVTVRLKDPR